MYMQQLGLCAVCHDPFGKQNPVVDHDHNTGTVRGLLHRKCNLLLGLAKDSVDRLLFAAEYLQKN